MVQQFGSNGDHNPPGPITAEAQFSCLSPQNTPDTSTMILLESESDAISARISPSCPDEVQRVLTAAWAHDVEAVKKLLDSPEKARCQDPITLESPLHAAIRSCGPPSEEDDAEDLENAKKTLSELLLWGGIWNDVDDRNETPGCVAHRLGRTDLYNLCVEAGVRAEMLFGVLEGYEELESGDEMEEDGEEESAHQPNDEAEMVVVGEDGAEAPELVRVSEENGVAENGKAGVDVNSEDYLKSTVTYSDGKLVDNEGNGVMMAWETDIMRRSVDALLLGKESGKRILNIGFGMGIIDTMFAETKPVKHHIIEAHPGVLQHISSPESKFGADWEASGPQAGAYKVYQGKWQEVCIQLLEENNVYDAIYFDTFGEDYSQLRMFFTEFIPGLLDSQGIFGFFNGLGADRAICYDVYTRVSELHLADAGLDVEWQVIHVDMSELAKAGEGEWEGVRRRYWTLDGKHASSCGKLHTLTNSRRISAACVHFHGVDNFHFEDGGFVFGWLGQCGVGQHSRRGCPHRGRPQRRQNTPPPSHAYETGIMTGYLRNTNIVCLQTEVQSGSK